MLRLLLIGVVLLLCCSPWAPVAAQAASADSAYRAGDVARAERLYAEILAADSADDVALHRMALLLAWRERYDASLALFDRLLRLAPSNADARVDRARVLAWRGETRRAVAALDSVLASRPGHAAALQARAQFLAWGGEHDAALRAYDRLLEVAPGLEGVRSERARVLLWAERVGEATAVYDSILAREPRNVAALQGRARVLTWGGRLVAGELAWRAALAVSPEDLTSVAGLAQVLRWQGRDAAAFELLTALEPARAAQRDVREQLMWLEVNLAPRVAPGFTYEKDSDENRIVTYAASGAYRPLLRHELRADAYLRHAADAPSSMQAWGGSVAYARQLEPGWWVSAGAGASASDAADADPVLSLRAAFSSPARYPVTLSVSLARSALDATAALIRRQVVTSEANLETRWVTGGWNAGAAAGFMRLDGRLSGASNERWSASASLNRRMARPLVVGLRGRAFGHAEDVADGYFDPELYTLAEVTARYLAESGQWSLTLEGSPGAQRIVRHGEGGSTSGSYRANARVSRLLGRGRQVNATFAFANSGLQQLSPGAAGDYRYLALGLSASWTF